MIEFDEYKVKLSNIRPKLDALADSLGIEAAKEEIDRLHAQIDSEGFWDNQEISQKVMKQSRTLEAKVARYEKMCSQWDDLYTLCEMAIEEGDDSMLPELTEGYAQLEQEMEKARLETLLSGEYDNNNAIVSFQAGAGGTEAQDWASMLYRMYTHWTEQHGLSYKILDYLDGDEAGIKSASILIEGENAYGLLKSENGVHRLVRISPFDANARRQTSFAAVEVMPDLPDDVEVRLQRGDDTGAEHLIEPRKRLTRFGKNNKTAYGAVQPVCHTEENIAGFLIFLFQVLLHSLRKRRITRLVCLDNLGSGLVDYNDMVVFVYNSHSVRLHVHTTIYLNHLS